MGKVRRKAVSASKEGLTSFVNRTYAKSTSVSVFSSEASAVLDGVNSRSAISKKLKRKLKHDNFMKKVTKPTKKKPNSNPLNLDVLRSELKEIQARKQAEATKPINPFFDASKVGSKKKRSNIKKQEMKRFAAVVNYSAFKEDPVKAVQKHLANTLMPNLAP